MKILDHDIEAGSTLSYAALIDCDLANRQSPDREPAGSAEGRPAPARAAHIGTAEGVTS